jgi:oligopeptidase B
MSFFPVAPKRPHEITQHGETRIDNYFWMRDREDPEVLRYLRAENDYLEEVMGHTKPLQETLYAEMKGRMQETDSTVPERRSGYLYYTRTEEGSQYPIYCRRKDSPESAEEILLDQNALAAGQSFCSVGAFTVSPDGTKLAFSLDVDGAEVYTLYIKDLETGQLYPESVERTFSSVYFRTGVEWANDSQTIFYMTLDESERPYRLFSHKIGTDISQDRLLFQENDETYSMFIHKTRDDAFIFTHLQSTKATESLFLSADHPDGELRVLSPRRDGVEYWAAHHQGNFFIVTNYEARNFRLMKSSVEQPEIEHWQEVIPHREDVLLDWVEAFQDHIVLYERKNALRQIRVSSPDALTGVRYIEFPEPAYSVDWDSNPNFNTTVLRFRYSSMVTPSSIVDYHMDTGEWQIIKREEIPTGFDGSQYVSERIYATAADGKLIPISLVHKKDLPLDGNNPTLLYGYGAYGAAIDADFNSRRFSLLDRGFVVGIAHIRGGSDMGRAWYEDGKLFNKKNSFTDFIACAEHLIKEGYTSKDKLAIEGGSAGGLLVSACLTMRPDLFKAVIAKVAFVDVVTTMSDPTIPLTTLEYDEWGNPEDSEYYKYMLSYSPYDNIRATEYPHMLITTGLNDPRVAYWEPAKFAAKLRELKTDSNLLLLQTNYASGHAGSSGRYDALKEVAVDYAFLIDRLCGQTTSVVPRQEALTSIELKVEYQVSTGI